MITEFVLNAILHHVGMSWIISSNEEMIYETEKNNHPDWLNKGPCDNTNVESKTQSAVKYVINNGYLTGRKA